MIETLIIMMPQVENYDSRDIILECPECGSRDVFTIRKRKFSLLFGLIIIRSKNVEACCRDCWHKSDIENFER